ncbi:MAG: hypothetical protein L0Y56_12150, partial [Nitrospira sp.]|nr:hypothetical protein [Nitrospira sp.]
GGSTIVGTYGYMPLEQFEGRAMPASDIYALGASLIYLLSHKEPGQIEKKELRLDFYPHVNVSEGFARILERMLEPAWERRYQSASHLKEELEGLLAGKTPSKVSKPFKGKTILTKPLSKSLGTIIAVVAVVVAIPVIAIVALEAISIRWEDQPLYHNYTPLHHRKRQQTMEYMKSIANAIDRYVQDSKMVPQGNINILARTLVPTYISGIPYQDGWGHAFVYVTTAKDAYTLKSGGLDGGFDAYTTRNDGNWDHDLAISNGVFIAPPGDGGN